MWKKKKNDPNAVKYLGRNGPPYDAGDIVWYKPAYGNSPRVLGLVVTAPKRETEVEQDFVWEYTYGVLFSTKDGECKLANVLKARLELFVPSKYSGWI